MASLTKREVITALVLPIIPIITFLLALLFFASGCEYLKPTCKVVSVVNQACVVLEYLGEDGQVHQVAVPPSELQNFAQATAARHEDAGLK